MSLLGIIFFIVLFALIGKAILETIWGSMLVINGLFWHAIAFALRTLANAIRLSKRIVGLFRKPKPAPKQFSMANALNTYFASSK